MKAYIIAVPEMDKIELDNENALTLNEAYALIHREHIHELIKAHAEKLGYKLNTVVNSLGEIPYVYLCADLSLKYGFSVYEGYIEISWQSFLKLTPDDVNDGTPINLAQNTVENIQLSATHNFNKQALLEAFTAGWDAAHNNRFSIGVNFDKWYHEKAGDK